MLEGRFRDRSVSPLSGKPNAAWRPLIGFAASSSKTRRWALWPFKFVCRLSPVSAPLSADGETPTDGSQTGYWMTSCKHVP